MKETQTICRSSISASDLESGINAAIHAQEKLRWEVVGQIVFAHHVRNGANVFSAMVQMEREKKSKSGELPSLAQLKKRSRAERNEDFWDKLLNENRGWIRSEGHDDFIDFIDSTSGWDEEDIIDARFLGLIQNRSNIEIDGKTYRNVLSSIKDYVKQRGT